jgi:hypothetical protein
MVGLMDHREAPEPAVISHACDVELITDPVKIAEREALNGLRQFDESSKW